MDKNFCIVFSADEINENIEISTSAVSTKYKEVDKINKQIKSLGLIGKVEVDTLELVFGSAAPIIREQLDNNVHIVIQILP